MAHDIFAPWAELVPDAPYPMTAADLEKLPDDSWRYELVRGNWYVCHHQAADMEILQQFFAPSYPSMYAGIILAMYLQPKLAFVWQGLVTQNKMFMLQMLHSYSLIARQPRTAWNG